MPLKISHLIEICDPPLGGDALRPLALHPLGKTTITSYRHSEPTYCHFVPRNFEIDVLSFFCHASMPILLLNTLPRYLMFYLILNNSLLKNVIILNYLKYCL